MIKKAAILLLLIAFQSKLLASGITVPPTKKTKREFKKTDFQVGFGLAGSVLYLSRNIKEDNDALGYTFVANYGGQKLCRVSVQYTYYKPINIAPTWYTIKANTFEANLELLARFKNGKTFLYPLTGLSYNTFQGFFTGQDDFLSLREHYKPNSTVRNNWIGLNIGTGLEHGIGPVVLFLDYRMRLGQMEKFGNFNIMDVCYGGGVRIKIYTPKSNGRLKKYIHNFGNRYNWF